MRWVSSAMAMLAIGGAWTGCGSDHIGNPACPYPDAPLGGLAVVHVCSAGLGLDASDGSKDAPFGTIAEGIAVAQPGDVVLIAGGEYQERVQVQVAISLVGLPGQTRLTAVAGERGVSVRADGRVLIKGLHIADATVAGIQVEGGAAVLLEDVEVHGTRADADGEFGYGISAFGGADLEIDAAVVRRSASHGIFVSDGDATIRGADLSGNLGGLRVEDATATVIDVLAVGNRQYGVAFVNAGGRLEGGEISGTVADANSQGGDGLFIASGDAGPASATAIDVIGVDMVGNARFGALVDRRDAVRLDANVISANDGGGAWIQRPGAGGARVEVCDNVIDGNTRVGLVAIADARVDVLDNVVTDTRLGPILDDAMIGDGLGVYRGADTLIVGNTIGGSARAGGVIDDAAGVLRGNTVDEAQFAVVAQADAQITDDGGNTFDGAAMGIVTLPPADALPVFGAALAVDGIEQ